MKKITSALMLMILVFAFSAKAYNCPDNLYFYVSNATSSTAFDKSGSTFTYTVDATNGDVYGVISDYAAKSWDDAHGHNAYFPKDKSGDVVVDKAQSWAEMTQWTATWNGGCFKFAKGNAYTVTISFDTDKLSAEVTIGEEIIDVNAPKFVVGQTYYIDPNACTWLFNGSAIFAVYDGATDVPCSKETIDGKTMLSFVPTAEGNNGKATIKRINPNNTGEVWNECSFSITDGDYNTFVVNSNFNGGSWTNTSGTPTPPTPPGPTDYSSWYVNVGGSFIGAEYWKGQQPSAEGYIELGTYAIGKNVFKIKTWNAADGDAFYKAASVTTGDNILSVGVENDTMTIQGAEDGDQYTLTFDIPTLTLNVTKVGEDPEPGPQPVFADNQFSAALTQLDVNGEIKLPVYLADCNKYCAGQWDITMPEGFSLVGVELNETTAPNHSLLTNAQGNLTKCIVYSPNNTLFVYTEGVPFMTLTIKANGVETGDYNVAFSSLLFNKQPSSEDMNVGVNLNDSEATLAASKAVASITLTPPFMALSVGESMQAAAEVTPADATVADLSWEVVEGDDIISFDPQTLTVKALTTGKAVIKVTAQDFMGVTATLEVTVDGKPVENIVISEEEYTIYEGESFQLSAVVTPDDATNKSVLWTSSDEDVAIVDQEGNVTGVGAGSATITATAKDGSDISASCEVTVKAKISGDADGDDHLTIMDVVIIAKHSIEIYTEGARLENMDLNSDGEINATDVTLAVYFLMQEEVTTMPEYAEISTNMLSLTTPEAVNTNTLNIPLYLQGATRVAGIQFDVVLPEGLELTENSYVSPASSDNHAFTFTKIGDNTYRVVIYSAKNFKSNAIGVLSVENKNYNAASADIDLNNVLYSDGRSLQCTDDSRTVLAITTGIDMMFAGVNDRHDIYNTAGVLVMRNADASQLKSLPAGLYIVEGRKVIK